MARKRKNERASSTAPTRRDAQRRGPMVQNPQVHQLEEFASSACGRVRVEVTIRDSMGPAVREDATRRCINITTINLMGAKSLALR